MKTNVIDNLRPWKAVHNTKDKPHESKAKCKRARRNLCADGVKFLVLDEADKMLSLGLQPQLYRLRKLLLPGKKKSGVAAPLILAPQGKRPKVSGRS